MRVPAHADPGHPEREGGREFGQHGLGPPSTGGRVSYQAHEMTSRDLLAGQIDNMTPQSTERGAQNMEDAKRWLLVQASIHLRALRGAFAEEDAVQS